jgi:hypothetical protein
MMLLPESSGGRVTGVGAGESDTAGLGLGEAKSMGEAAGVSIAANGAGRWSIKLGKKGKDEFN